MPEGEEEVEWKAQAMRAVVANDAQPLEDVLKRLPVNVWSNWRNKAGKDLVTLSEERGSSAAYSILARYLGVLKEQKRQAFEDREDVWVLVHGELQPRRATIVEEVDDDAQNLLVEFWDGDEPAIYVDRSMVLKSY